MVYYLLAAQAAAASPVRLTEPAACGEYKQVIAEAWQLGPNVVILRPGEKPSISADGRMLLATRDELAEAMKADNPNLDKIERLMREELRLRELISSRRAAAKLACDLGLLRQLDRAKLREQLKAIRPRTSAEIESARRNARVPPPPPIPGNR